MLGEKELSNAQCDATITMFQDGVLRVRFHKHSAQAQVKKVKNIWSDLTRERFVT